MCGPTNEVALYAALYQDSSNSVYEHSLLGIPNNGLALLLKGCIITHSAFVEFSVHSRSLVVMHEAIGDQGDYTQL